MNENAVSAELDCRTLNVSGRLGTDNGDPLILVPVEPLQTTLAKVKEEGWEMTLMKDRTDSSGSFLLPQSF